MSTADTPFSFVAFIRRLSKAGSALFIFIGNSDISRLGLRHGQAIEIDLGRVRIAGIVKSRRRLRACKVVGWGKLGG